LRNSRAIVLQKCGQGNWEGARKKNDSFVHKGLEVQQYLVKTKP